MSSILLYFGLEKSNDDHCIEQLWIGVVLWLNHIVLLSNVLQNWFLHLKYHDVLNGCLSMYGLVFLAMKGIQGEEIGFSI